MRKFLRPTTGIVTMRHGEPYPKPMPWGKNHKGMDIANSEGTPIMCPYPGTVTTVSFDVDGYGWHVKMKHDGFTTLYAHMLKSILVDPWDKIECGHVIGYMDSTGASTGPHLHFEVFVSGISVDPEKFAQFYDNCDYTNLAPPTIPPMEDEIKPLEIDIPKKSFTVSVPMLRIRSEPNVVSEELGWLYDGDKIEVTSISGMDLWGKHEKGWTALSHPDCDGSCVE